MGALWARVIKNSGESTRPLARAFARLLALFTRSLALHYLLRSRAPLCSLICSHRSLCSLPSSWDSELLMSQNDLILPHCASVSLNLSSLSSPLSSFPLQGENMFGLSDLAVVRIIESLPGIEHISNYNFRFGRSPHMELPLAINPTGCARSEPKLRTHFQSVRPRTLMTRSMGSRLPSSVSGRF